jgi:uroporphyrinogen-III decarboxylase
MTSRERLLNVFNFAGADHVPVTLFVTDTDISDGLCDCVLGERTGDAVDDMIRFCEAIGADVMLRTSAHVFEPIAFDAESDSWRHDWRLDEGGNRLAHRIITPAGELTESFNLAGEEFHGDCTKDWMKLRNVRTEAPIKRRQDLELVAEYRPPVPDYDLSYTAKAARRLGDGGIVLPRAPSSVFNSAAALMNLEDLLTAAITDRPFYGELMELCLSDVTAAGAKIAGGGGDVMRVVGNIANSGLVGPDFYAEHVLPYEKRYIDSLSSGGAKVLFHNCGACRGLLGVYGAMLRGHALESLSPPAAGGDVESLRGARDSLGENVVMVGNFDQVHTLKEGSPDDIRAQARRIFAETAGDGAFVFSTSDSLAPGTPRANIEALVECALELAEKG